MLMAKSYSISKTYKENDALVMVNAQQNQCKTNTNGRMRIIISIVLNKGRYGFVRV